MLPFSREQKGKTIVVADYYKNIDKNNKTQRRIDVPMELPSNAEIKRWLKKKSILINGKTPDVNDEIEFPIWELVFFHKSKNRITL